MFPLVAQEMKDAAAGRAVTGFDVDDGALSGAAERAEGGELRETAGQRNELYDTPWGMPGQVIPGEGVPSPARGPSGANRRPVCGRCFSHES